MIDRYHLRAWKFRNNLWQSHVRSVTDFLKSWNPQSKKLILVGPSGGYSLPTEWFKRFQLITIVEPGFIGRQIATRKFREVTRIKSVRRALHFDRPGFFSDFDLTDTAVLFTNVLGQVKVSSAKAFAHAMRETLTGLEWASYHDRLSADHVRWTHPDGAVGRVYATSELVKNSITEDEAKIKAQQAKAGKRDVNKSLEVQEHLASDALAPLGPKRTMYWEWQIAPDQVHLIEGMIHE